VKRVVRLLISAGLLALLLVRMDWTGVTERLAHLHPSNAALLITALGTQLLLSSWKWGWALRMYELNFPYGFLTRVLVIGFFLNNFLPTSIGGDAYRVYRTIPETSRKSRAISAVLLERLVGFAALAALGFIAALTLYETNELARAYVVLALAGGAISLTILVLAVRAREWSSARWLKSSWLTPVKDIVAALTTARVEWLPLIAISIAFQVQAILIIHFLFATLDIEVSLAQSALMAAAAGFATVIPISINGLGVVEASIAGVGLALGVSYDAGLLVALLIRVLVLPLTLIAGLVYAFEPVRASTIANPFRADTRAQPQPVRDV
jgi:uncharacterized protein (TIRG00374 family)